MAKYKVQLNGKSYEVEAASPQAAAEAAEQFARQGSRKVGGVEDVARAVPAGLATGVAAPVGAAGDIAGLFKGLIGKLPGDSVYEKAAIRAVDLGASLIGPYNAAGTGGFNGMVRPKPSTDQVLQALPAQSVTRYQPQTTAGEYAKTAAAFVPAAAIPGSAPMRVANVLAPAMASETAGQVAREVAPNWEAEARVMGGVAGGAMAPRLASAARPQISAPKADIRVAQTIGRALERDQMTPQQAQQLIAQNPDAVPLQYMGENFTAVGDVLANAPGKSRPIIRDALQASRDRAPDAIKRDIAQGMGGTGDYFDNLAAMKEQRKAAAMPLRDAAFGSPLDPVRYNSEIAPVMARVPQSALNFAAKIAELEGRNPTELGFITERMGGGGTKDVQVRNPTMETLHYIKKGLDQELDGFRNQTTGKLDLEGSPMAGATSSVRTDLGQAMRRASPEYDAFMQQWGDDSGHIEAFRLGREVFNTKNPVGLVKKRVEAMNPVERERFQEGAGEALMEMVKAEGNGGVATMRKILRVENNGDKLRLAFNDDAAFGQFMDSANKRVMAQDRNNRILGGSPTMPRQAAAADLGTQPMGAADAAEAGMKIIGQGPRGALGLAAKLIPRKDNTILGNPVLNERAGAAFAGNAELQQLLKLLEDMGVRRDQTPPLLLPNRSMLPGGYLGGLTGQDR